MMNAEKITDIRRKGAKDKWEFYQDKRDEYRWRRSACNGNIVGSSSEGYTTKASAFANAIRHGYRPEDKK